MLIYLFMNRAAADNVKRDEAFFRNGIRHLAKLYHFDASDDFDYSAFHRILEQLDGHFTVMTTLRELSARSSQIMGIAIYGE